jgi:hypothetical protein
MFDYSKAGFIPPFLLGTDERIGVIQRWRVYNPSCEESFYWTGHFFADILKGLIY